MDTRNDPTTPGTLPASIVEDYRTLGFARVPQVLTESEVTEYLAEARRTFAEHPTSRWELGGGLVAFDWVPDANRRSPLLQRLALHPRVTGIAEKLAGGPLRLFKSELLRKQPDGAAAITPAHDDRKTFPFRGTPGAITAWLALVDVPVECGCLAFIPGSHLRSEPAEGDIAAEIYPLTRWPELARTPRIATPLRAGDVTFHHERTVHLAGVNKTSATRIALATVYMSATSTYRPSSFYAGLYPDDPDLGGMTSDQPWDGARFPVVSPDGSLEEDGPCRG